MAWGGRYRFSAFRDSQRRIDSHDSHDSFEHAWRGRCATSCVQVDYGRFDGNLCADCPRKLLYGRHDFPGHFGDDVHRRDTLETVGHLIGHYRYCRSRFVLIFAFCTGLYDRIHERMARLAPFAYVGQSCTRAWEYTGGCGGLRPDQESAGDACQDSHCHM